MHDLTYDLHIHSCLSPCGDGDSTPGNIVGMAAVKGLDIIALTDHNTCRNTPAAKAMADEYGIMFIPGMELTTAEEVHCLCLFETVEAALDWDRYVYGRLIRIENRPEIFGEQVICDENDEPAGTEKMLLINATDIMFDDVYGEVEKFGGVMIPAHLEKSSTSLISNLGSIPPGSKFRTVEINHMDKYHELRSVYDYIGKCRVICDSDAHYITDIHEPVYSIKTEEKSVKAVLDCLRGE